MLAVANVRPRAFAIEDSATRFISAGAAPVDAHGSLLADEDSAVPAVAMAALFDGEPLTPALPIARRLFGGVGRAGALKSIMLVMARRAAVDVAASSRSAARREADASPTCGPSMLGPRKASDCDDWSW